MPNTNKKISRDLPRVTPPVSSAVNMRRRNFIKFTVFGGLAFLMGKYLSPLVNTLRGDMVIDEKVFNNFKITETGKAIKITDDDNAELLVIDKESF